MQIFTILEYVVLVATATLEVFKYENKQELTENKEHINAGRNGNP